jgi:hypothetical protein
MNAARGMSSIGRSEAAKAGSMMRMAAPKRGNQYRSVQEFSQPFSSCSRFSRAASPKSGIDEMLLAPWNTQIPDSLRKVASGRTGRSVIRSPSLSSSSAVPGVSRSRSRTGLGTTIRPARSSVTLVVAMVEYYGKWYLTIPSSVRRRTPSLFISEAPSLASFRTCQCPSNAHIHHSMLNNTVRFISLSQTPQR